MQLLLLPGLDGTGRMFEPLLGELPSSLRARVVAYPLDRPLSYRELLPIVEAAANELGEFVVVGESFSGPLALMLAERRPTGLRGVVLCASFISSPIAVLKPLKFLLRSLLFRVRPHWLLSWLLFGRHRRVDLVRLLGEAVGSVTPEVKAARVRSIADVDVTRELQECPAPILYLRGIEDRLVSRRSWEQLKSARPDAELKELLAPHLLLQSFPREAAAILEAFCAARQENGSSGNR